VITDKNIIAHVAFEERCHVISRVALQGCFGPLRVTVSHTRITPRTIISVPRRILGLRPPLYSTIAHNDPSLRATHQHNLSSCARSRNAIHQPLHASSYPHSRRNTKARHRPSGHTALAATEIGNGIFCPRHEAPPLATYIVTNEADQRSSHGTQDVGLNTRPVSAAEGQAECRGY
jgi:hypothetical protein